MSSMINYKGALYVEADGIIGFSEDLNVLCDSLPPQLEALLARAKKLGLKKVALDLSRLLVVVKAFTKKEPPDLDLTDTQEMPIAASKKT